MMSKSDVNFNCRNLMYVCVREIKWEWLLSLNRLMAMVSCYWRSSLPINTVGHNLAAGNF